MTTDCPTGLVCTPGRGCGLKPEGEGGASDSGTKDGGATADASGDVSASNTDALGSD